MVSYLWEQICMALSSFLISWSLLRRSFYSEAGIKASWGSSNVMWLVMCVGLVLSRHIRLVYRLSRNSWWACQACLSIPWMTAFVSKYKSWNDYLMTMPMPPYLQLLLLLPSPRANLPCPRTQQHTTNKQLIFKHDPLESYRPARWFSCLSQTGRSDAVLSGTRLKYMLSCFSLGL